MSPSVNSTCMCATLVHVHPVPRQSLPWDRAVQIAVQVRWCGACLVAPLSAEAEGRKVCDKQAGTSLLHKLRHRLHRVALEEEEGDVEGLQLGLHQLQTPQHEPKLAGASIEERRDLLVLPQAVLSILQCVVSLDSLLGPKQFAMVRRDTRAHRMASEGGAGSSPS